MNKTAWNKGLKMTGRKKMKKYRHKKISEGFLNRIFSEWIRKRDMIKSPEFIGLSGDYCKCFTCDKIIAFKKQSQASHFISRRYNATKYDPLNVHVCCIRCNMYEHGNQYVYSLKLDEKYGQGTAYSLYQKSLQPLKLDNKERIKIRNLILEWHTSINT